MKDDSIYRLQFPVESLFAWLLESAYSGFWYHWSVYLYIILRRDFLQSLYPSSRRCLFALTKLWYVPPLRLEMQDGYQHKSKNINLCPLKFSLTCCSVRIPPWSWRYFCTIGRLIVIWWAVASFGCFGWNWRDSLIVQIPPALPKNNDTNNLVLSISKFHNIFQQCHTFLSRLPLQKSF